MTEQYGESPNLCIHSWAIKDLLEEIVATGTDVMESVDMTHPDGCIADPKDKWE